MALLIILFMLTGCGEKAIQTPDDVIGKRIAVLENTSSVIFAQMYGSEVRICTDKKALAAAVKLGDVDCALVDERDEKYVKRFQVGIKTVDEPFMETGLRIAAAYENPDLIKDINAAIYYLEEEGIIKDIIKGHYNKDEFIFEPDAVSEDAKTLTVAVCDQSSRFAYYNENGELCGIDVDIAKAICAYLGLKCEIKVMDWDDLIPAVRSGAVHFALGGITEKSPNADICIMSEPYTQCTQLIIVD